MAPIPAKLANLVRCEQVSTGENSDRGLGVPRHVVQVGDEAAQVVEATLTDVAQVLLQRDLKQLLQAGLLGDKHLHHHAKRLTILTVNLP